MAVVSGLNMLILLLCCGCLCLRLCCSFVICNSVAIKECNKLMTLLLIIVVVIFCWVMLWCLSSCLWLFVVVGLLFMDVD